MKLSNKPKFSYERKKKLIAYVFLIPWIAGAVYFFVIPLIQSVLYSFGDLKISAGRVDVTFKGFDNYIYIFTRDRDATRLLIESVSGMLLNIVYITILSLCIAVILKQSFKGRMLVRAVFFLPVIITSGVVISIIRSDAVTGAFMSAGQSNTMVKSFELGVILRGAGFPTEVTNILMGIVSGVFDLTWKSGVQILILLAGLQTVPSHLYEASRIDGATGWENFWFITFPLVTPVLLLTTVYSVIDVLSDYGNRYQQKILEYITKINYSYSSALSSVYFVCIFLLVGLVFLIMRRRVFYMAD